VTALTFDAGTHTYRRGGVVLPSVTQVLKWVGVYNLDMVDPAILEEKAELGNAIHRAILIDFYQRGIALPVDDPDIGIYCTAWQEMLKLLPLEVHETELVIHGEEGYAGTVDILGRLAGEWAVGDLKSTTKLNHEALAMQTAGYAHAIEEERGIEITKRFGLHLRRDGSYRYEPCGDFLDWWEFRQHLIRYRAFHL
jgi:hypothetical protein